MPTSDMNILQIIRLPLPLIQDGVIHIGPFVAFDGCALMYPNGTWETIPHLWSDDKMIRYDNLNVTKGSVQDKVDLAKYYLEIEHGYEKHSIVRMQNFSDEPDSDLSIVMVAHKSSGLW